MSTVAILGAGKMGTVVARLAISAGYEVRIAGSGDPSRIELIVGVLAPGARAMWSKDALDGADIVVLATPLSAYDQLPADALRGKLVVDAMNYWWETDGERPEFAGPDASTSELVQQQLPGAVVVKALNHMGYHDLDERGRSVGDPDRRAIAVAGPADAARDVERFVDALGFDPLYIGDLAQGVHLQPFHAAFGAATDLEGLRTLVEEP